MPGDNKKAKTDEIKGKSESAKITNQSTEEKTKKPAKTSSKKSSEKASQQKKNSTKAVSSSSEATKHSEKLDNSKEAVTEKVQKKTNSATAKKSNSKNSSSETPNEKEKSSSGNKKSTTKKTSSATKEQARALKERAQASIKKSKEKNAESTEKVTENPNISDFKEAKKKRNSSKSKSAVSDSSATAKKENDGNSSSTYNPLASPIFSKPIFVYQDEAPSKKAEAQNTDLPEEIRDESLDMLLDLQMDEDDTEILDTEASIFSRAENDDLGIFSKIEESADLPDSDILPSNEESIEILESESVINEESDSLPIDNSEYNAEEANEIDNVHNSEENTEVTVATEDESINEISFEDESIAELPPLMDIEHFSDYKSKNVLDEDAEQMEFIPSEPEEELIEDDSDECKNHPHSVIYSDDDNFQQGFFDCENLTIFDNTDNQETEKSEKEIKAEPKNLPDEQKYNPEKPRRIDFRFDFIELFVFTLVAIMILTTFVFKHSIVEGPSMQNTLQDGDHLIIFDLFYSPEPGDIIVFEDYSTGLQKPLVKRVIAVGGQTVKIDIFGDIYVDGVKLNEDYIYLDGFDSLTKPLICTVPEGEVFVMGDHRNNSTDSRKPAFGTIKEDSILGKVILRFYPFDSFGAVE